MRVGALLGNLRHFGVVVGIADDDPDCLEVDAPAGFLTPEWIRRIRHQKAAILARLRRAGEVCGDRTNRAPLCVFAPELEGEHLIALTATPPSDFRCQPEEDALPERAVYANVRHVTVTGEYLDQWHQVATGDTIMDIPFEELEAYADPRDAENVCPYY